MANNVSAEESQQLLQTIEMFEAIVKASPDDCQSLEILKEAYTKLGRQEDNLRTSRRLAEAYVHLGQISQAILEYEGILKEAPHDDAAQAALNKLAKQTADLGIMPPAATPAPPPVAPAKGPVLTPQPMPGRELADALIAEKLVTPQAVEPLLQRLRDAQATVLEKKQPVTLAQLLVDEHIAKMEDVLDAMINRSGLPYLPLSFYDVDRDIALLLPTEMCLRLCVVPVDLISRSVLVATADPFCPALRAEVAAVLEYHIFWYVASPAEIASTIRRTHGLDGKHGGA